MKAELKRLAKQCSIDPLNTLIRQNFKITKRKYKKLLKKKETFKKLLKKKELQYVHTIRDKLIDTLNKDPQSFWNSVKELRKNQCDQDGHNPIHGLITLKLYIVNKVKLMAIWKCLILIPLLPLTYIRC